MLARQPFHAQNLELVFKVSWQHARVTWDVQGDSCMYIKEAGGFDWMLCFSIITSLGSSALCFVYLDMNDHRFGRDRLHQAELAALLCYRTAELSARITLLALFAVPCYHAQPQAFTDCRLPVLAHSGCPALNDDKALLRRLLGVRYRSTAITMTAPPHSISTGRCATTLPLTRTYSRAVMAAERENDSMTHECIMHGLTFNAFPCRMCTISG